MEDVVEGWPDPQLEIEITQRFGKNQLAMAVPPQQCATVTTSILAGTSL